MLYVSHGFYVNVKEGETPSMAYAQIVYSDVPPVVFAANVTDGAVTLKRIGVLPIKQRLNNINMNSLYMCTRKTRQQ